MRSSAFVALIVIFCLFAFACLGYYHYQRKQVLASVNDNPIVQADVGRSYSVSAASVVGESAELPIRLTRTAPESEAETLKINKDDTIVRQDDEELYESLDGWDLETQEACCPEEELLTRAGKLRAELVEQHGNIPEIDEYFKLSDKNKDRVPLTPDESLEWYRLLAWFFPSQENIKSYETAQWFFRLYREDALPGSYSMTYDD